MRVTDEALRAMTDAIVEILHPEQVVLFGSRAHSDAEDASDVDLIVVTAEPFGKGRSRRDATARLYRELSRFLVSKDILLYSRDEVDRWKDSPGHVVARGIREGRVLYAQH